MTGHRVTDEQALADLVKRLRRAEGQIGGVIRMLEEGRSCEDIVTQMAAVSKAINRSAFTLISAGMRECLAGGADDAEESAASLQKLFMSLA